MRVYRSAIFTALIKSQSAVIQRRISSGVTSTTHHIRTSFKPPKPSMGKVSIQLKQINISCVRQNISNYFAVFKFNAQCGSAPSLPGQLGRSLSTRHTQPDHYWGIIRSVSWNRWQVKAGVAVECSTRNVTGQIQTVVTRLLFFILV